MVVEIAKTSAAYDRGVKLRLYAANRIPTYWIVNVADGIVEVYTQPRGGKSPTYRHREDFGAGKEIPVILDGKEIGRIPVLTIMPFLGE